MDADHLTRLLDVLSQGEVGVWLDGGWGVDALLEEQTREHHDVDVVVELSNVQRLAQLPATEGYEVVTGVPPQSFVLVDAIGPGNAAAGRRGHADR